MIRVCLAVAIAMVFVAIMSCCARQYTAPMPAPTLPAQEPSDDAIADDGAGAVFGRYKVYFGNTHAHTFYSDHICDTIGSNAGNSPEQHLSLAKESGYDFYCITDHSHDGYNGEYFSGVTWRNTARLTSLFTDNNFVAIRGFEFSENTQSDGAGHINVLSSEDCLCAHRSGVNLAYFYNWLTSASGNGVTASFNHPAADASDGFGSASPQTTQIVTMCEVINGEARDKESGTATPNDNIWRAWAKGWRVSPVAGCDNHGVWSISRWSCRTGVVATSLSPEAILTAMRNGRTYATYDKNLSAFYTANGQPMGARIDRSASVDFVVYYDDPDTQITKIEILDDSKTVVKSQIVNQRSGAWSVRVSAAVSSMYVVMIYTPLSGNESIPTAFLAPVWIR